LGFFFGLFTFIIISVIDNTKAAITSGIFAWIFFGGVLTAYMDIHEYINDKRYSEYCAASIQERVLYTDTFCKLNGETENIGRLYLTDSSLIFVMLKRKKEVIEKRMPVNSIVNISERHDFGHLSNILILQQDGSETRAITDYKQLYDKLFPSAAQE